MAKWLLVSLKPSNCGKELTSRTQDQLSNLKLAFSWILSLITCSFMAKLSMPFLQIALDLWQNLLERVLLFPVSAYLWNLFYALILSTASTNLWAANLIVELSHSNIFKTLPTKGLFWAVFGPIYNAGPPSKTIWSTLYQLPRKIGVEGEMWMRGPSGPFEGCGQIWLGEGWLDDWRRLITVENCILTPLLHQRAPTNWLLTCKAALMPTEWEIWASQSGCRWPSGLRLLLINRLLARGGGCRADQCRPCPDLSKITAKGLFSSRLWAASNEVQLGKICVAHPNPSAVPESTRQFIATPKCEAEHPHPHFLLSTTAPPSQVPQMLKFALHQVLISRGS